MQQNNVAVKEMEAAGIAWALHFFGTPFFCLKSITDIVDGELAQPTLNAPSSQMLMAKFT